MKAQGSMSNRSVWVFESVVTALVVLGLIYVASFRYARPLVDPAPLTALTEIPRFCSSKFPTLGRSAA